MFGRKQNQGERERGKSAVGTHRLRNPVGENEEPLKSSRGGMTGLVLWKDHSCCSGGGGGEGLCN